MNHRGFSQKPTEKMCFFEKKGGKNLKSSP